MSAQSKRASAAPWVNDPKRGVGCVGFSPRAALVPPLPWAGMFLPFQGAGTANKRATLDAAGAFRSHFNGHPNQFQHQVINKLAFPHFGTTYADLYVMK